MEQLHSVVDRTSNYFTMLLSGGLSVSPPSGSATLFLKMWRWNIMTQPFRKTNILNYVVACSILSSSFNIPNDGSMVARLQAEALALLFGCSTACLVVTKGNNEAEEKWTVERSSQTNHFDDEGSQEASQSKEHSAPWPRASPVPLSELYGMLDK
nr:hypothetical protein Iba_chr10cCG6320 [Ipomoea batatas]